MKKIIGSGWCGQNVGPDADTITSHKTGQLGPRLCLDSFIGARGQDHGTVTCSRIKQGYKHNLGLAFHVISNI